MMRPWKRLTVFPSLFPVLGTTYAFWMISLVFSLLVNHSHSAALFARAGEISHGSVGGDSQSMTRGESGLSNVAAVERKQTVLSLGDTNSDKECSGHGYFNDELGYCVCDDGFEGFTPQDCRISLQCGENGQLLENGSCSCFRFFTGPRCEDIACENYGEISSENSLECSCPVGFSGSYCQLCVIKTEEPPSCSDPNSIAAHLYRHKWWIGGALVVLLLFAAFGFACCYWKNDKKTLTEEEAEEGRADSDCGLRRNMKRDCACEEERQILTKDNDKPSGMSGDEAGKRDQDKLFAQVHMIARHGDQLLDEAPKTALKGNMSTTSGFFSKSSGR